ncbi:porin [Pseudoduganella albidiflava]|uniref:Porin n=1 Tax=Pseudoduganella albidiflava TaxID=321983 RepID=A0A411X726_9BURK|nr:porin [Pseudoduganella albidiflava]QBI04615.1 porin [Pseudoduganella albidiflava]GGY28674.1 porin [Pseudoduganella albidiflava]
MTLIPRLSCCVALLACALPATAQTSITIMGGVDAFVGSMKNSGDADRTTVLGSGGMTTSWFGFRGKEDLGDGLYAEFYLTGFFQTDTGVSGRFAGDNLFSRDANVALVGRLGRLQVGRASAPSFLPNILFNPFGDSFTFSPLVLHSYVPTGPFAARTWASTNAGDSGWSNQVVYTTPSFGGLRAGLHYQAGERGGDSDRNNLAISAMYNNGPLALTTFVHRVRASNPNSGAPIIDATRSPVNYALLDEQRAVFVGATYDFTRIKLYGTWQRTLNDAAGAEGLRDRTYSVGFSMPAGPGAVLFDVADTRRGGTLFGTGRSRRTASLGYDYRLSKRTDLYTVAMRDRITTLPSAMSYGVGVRHSY